MKKLEPISSRTLTDFARAERVVLELPRTLRLRGDANQCVLDCAHGLAQAKPKNFPYFSYFPRRGCGGSRQKMEKEIFGFARRFHIDFFNLIYGSKYFQSVNNWLEAQSGLGELCIRPLAARRGTLCVRSVVLPSSLSDWISILSVTFSTSLIFSSTHRTAQLFVSYKKPK